jgi:RNA recognition motif-containing protein
MNIYMGNISYDVTEADLQAAFEAFGAVASVNIIKDQYSGQSKGFGFVEMPSASEAQAAITGLHGKELLGRTLTVNEARPRAEAAARSGVPGGLGTARGGDDAGRHHVRGRSHREECPHHGRHDRLWHRHHTRRRPPVVDTDHPHVWRGTKEPRRWLSKT